ncbi:hypothetical protein AGLY_016766, partial [Aphis glycines]
MCTNLKISYILKPYYCRNHPQNIPQCTKCQRFTHMKKCCHLPPRCVKCAAIVKKPTIRRLNVSTVIATTRNDNNNSSRLPRNNFQAEQSSPAYTSNKPHDNTFVDKRLYASATKNKLNNHSNKKTDNDVLNSLLPLIKAFVSQLLLRNPETNIIPPLRTDINLVISDIDKC